MKRAIYLLFLLVILVNCHSQQKQQMSNPTIFADVQIKKENDKLLVQFQFYRDMSDEIDGVNFRKGSVVVDFPKLDGKLMEADSSQNVDKIYFAEIKNVKKDYTVTFMRKDGQYRGSLHIDPDNLNQLMPIGFRK
jgi:hypothetical protein